MSAIVPSGRFFYNVCRVGSAWELSFGDGGSVFLYDSEQEALEAAHVAARLHWRDLSHPSGVSVEAPDRRRAIIDYYGSWV